MNRKIYLDHVATTQMPPEVLDAMLPYLKEVYGNPSSLHTWGQEAQGAIDEARAKVAALVGGKPEEIFFTASGTESNNFAVKGLALSQQSMGKHIVVSEIEHFSVLHSARTLEKWGFEVSLVPVDRYGVVDPQEVLKRIRKETILVSIMHANGEVGTIEPIAEIAKLLKEKEITFHTDAVATTGVIPVNVQELGVDALSLAGNMFYGPKGTAALWLRKGKRIIPLLDGGIQEGGRRAGTENVAAIVGLGKAAELAMRDMLSRIKHLASLSQRLLEELPARIDHVVVTGHPQKRLPGHASFCIEFIEGESILMLLDSHGVAVSSGSACTSRALKSSHVLAAMGIPTALAQGSVLLSFGLDNVPEDVDYVLEVLPPIADRLRKMSPLYDKFLKSQRGGK